MKITAVLTGVREWRQAVQMMSVETRHRVRAAIQVTTLAVEEGARRNVPVSGPEDRKAKGRPGPGELRDTIRSSFSNDGLVGFVNAGFGKLARRSRATRPAKFGPMRLKAFQRQQKRIALKALRELGVYAMVVEYGSPGRGIPGAFYMTRAKEAQRAQHIARIKAALAGAAASVSRAA